MEAGWEIRMATFTSETYWLLYRGKTENRQLFLEIIMILPIWKTFMKKNEAAQEHDWQQEVPMIIIQPVQHCCKRHRYFLNYRRRVSLNAISGWYILPVKSFRLIVWVPEIY